MDKKNHLLDVATSLFSVRGYENTSVALICETAGVSKGLVFHHFKTKDALLRAIFERTTEKVIETSMPLTDKKGSPHQKLQQLIETLFAELQANKNHYQLNLNLMVQPKTRVVLQDLIEQRSLHLFTTVNAIFKKINPKQSEAISYLFLAEIDGIALHYLSIYDPYPLQEIKQQLLKKYAS